MYCGGGEEGKKRKKGRREKESESKGLFFWLIGLILQWVYYIGALF
jgi:hypothetical protein